MNYLIVFAIYSISYIIRNISGPFNIVGIIRNWLLRSKRFGLFFYELFNCPWCIGFHSGYLAYLLIQTHLSIKDIFLYGFIGSGIVPLFDSVLNYFNKNEQ